VLHTFDSGPSNNSIIFHSFDNQKLPSDFLGHALELGSVPLLKITASDYITNNYRKASTIPISRISLSPRHVLSPAHLLLLYTNNSSISRGLSFQQPCCISLHSCPPHPDPSYPASGPFAPYSLHWGTLVKDCSSALQPLSPFRER
jgi:hypothetical protein